MVPWAPLSRSQQSKARPCYDCPTLSSTSISEALLRFCNWEDQPAKKYMLHVRNRLLSVPTTWTEGKAEANALLYGP